MTAPPPPPVDPAECRHQAAALMADVVGTEGRPPADPASLPYLMLCTVLAASYTLLAISADLAAIRRELRKGK